MGAGHDHAVTARPRDGSGRGDARRRLRWALVLVASYLAVEVVAGFLTNSLALLSDAGHMLTDVVGLSMALAAVHAADRGSSDRRKTYGLYRLEILAALANTVLLLGIAVWIVVEALRRLSDPPEVLGVPMLVVAVVGLAVNLVAFRLLRGGVRDSLNVEGAYLEVLADTLGSVAVIVAGVVISTTGFRLIDPLFGVGIGLFVLPRALRLGRKALRILLQAAPPELDLEAIEHELAGLPDVIEAHDLHVWTLTSGMEVASVHLLIGEQSDAHAVLAAARALLRDRHGLAHATVQVETTAHRPCGGCHGSDPGSGPGAARVARGAAAGTAARRNQDRPT